MFFNTFSWDFHEKEVRSAKVLHFNTGRVRERLLGAGGLKWSKRDTDYRLIWAWLRKYVISKHCIYYKWRILLKLTTTGPYVEICLNFWH